MQENDLLGNKDRKLLFFSERSISLTFVDIKFIIFFYLLLFFFVFILINTDIVHNLYILKKILHYKFEHIYF